MPNNNNSSFTKGQKQLILLISILAILLILGITILIFAYKYKKDTNSLIPEISKPLIHNYEFAKECYPLKIEYREKYIALHSNKCKSIKLIDLTNYKITEINY